MTIASSHTMTLRAAAAARAMERIVTDAARRIAAFHLHRKAERALMALDDHGLHDIGIHRSEIHSAIRPGEDRRRR